MAMALTWNTLPDANAEMLSILFQVLHIMWQIGLQKANVDFFPVNNKDF